MYYEARVSKDKQGRGILRIPRAAFEKMIEGGFPSKTDLLIELTGPKVLRIYVNENEPQ